MRAVERSAAFVCLILNKFRTAMDLFLSSRSDPRDAIFLFPGLLTSASTYKPPRDTHGVYNISMVAKTPPAVVAAGNALASYLAAARGSRTGGRGSTVADIDTALVKLLASRDAAQLVALVGGRNSCVVEECTA